LGSVLFGEHAFRRTRCTEHPIVSEALILIPGLLCDAEVWAPQVAALADLATPHVPDHGSRDSLGGMAEAILERAPAQFALAGHSMGGRVALEIMRRAPQRVRALALLDTGYLALAAGAAGERERAGRLELLEVARREGMRAMCRRWLAIPTVHPARLGDEVLAAPILAMFERKTPAIFEAQIRALLERPDASAVLPEIRCPTLLLCGREDALSTLAAHEQMAQSIPGSTLVSIAHCGHMATLEQPAEVNAALRSWLGRLRLERGRPQP
jgi:pimeloyl-ACP methyl ester carboxylesterase